MQEAAIQLFRKKIGRSLERREPLPEPVSDRPQLPDDNSAPTPHRAMKAACGYSATKNGEEAHDENPIGGKIGCALRSVVPLHNHSTRVTSAIAQGVLGAAEALALSKYIKNHNLVEGRSKSQEFGMSGGGGGYRTGGGLPCSREEWSAGEWKHYIDGRLPEEHKVNLERIIDLFHAEKKEISLQRLGQALTKSAKRDVWEGGVVGYLVAVSELLNKLDRDYQRNLSKKYIDRGEKIKYKKSNAILASNFQDFF